MDYRIVSPEEILENKQDFLGKIDITDFDLSLEYKSYRDNFLEGIESIFEKYSVDYKARKKLLSRYTQPSRFIQVRSHGLIVNFYWPNGELKTLSFLDKYLISDQPYWLQYYPFIDLIHREAHSYARINHRFKDMAIEYELREQKTTLLTHNNHFGHFFFDDFPRIILDNLQYPVYINQSLRPSNLSRGILDLISTSVFNVPCTNSLRTNEMSITKSKDILQSFITNPIVNSYLITKSFKKHRDIVKDKRIQEDRIYLKRSGKYQSRIRNQNEVDALLESEEFSTIDPSNYSTLELIEKLSNASIVVSEAGTSCLVASLYSPPTVKIIALVPEDLLRSPKEDMIISGLPYHLASPNNIEFVLGIKADTHNIQSSKKCFYNLNTIKDKIILHKKNIRIA